MPGTAWKNMELRTYQIRSLRDTADADCQLLEVEASRLRRS
jgi:hypothetical protein